MIMVGKSNHLPTKFTLKIQNRHKKRLIGKWKLRSGRKIGVSIININMKLNESSMSHKYHENPLPLENHWTLFA